ncbi:hypothetical protein C8R45DRAFT_382144 [Mycena sanguinolenta]|nr:hypothetical protein C8R45DRAFT_382144 [Mycena sanguinolenta]
MGGALHSCLRPSTTISTPIMIPSEHESQRDHPDDSERNAEERQDDGGGALAERTVHDIITTRDILLCFCPPELVYIILHLSESWVEVRSVRAHEITVTANNSLSYLVTPSILDREQFGSEDIHLKVARVEFKIVSHDQGWCSDQTLTDTSVILRPSDADPTVVDEVQNTAGEGRRWAVQKNYTASSDFRKHIVAWDADGSLTAGPGAGGDTGFIDCLEAGDRIELIARAMHPGWANWIRSAQMSVYYGIA